MLIYKLYKYSSAVLQPPFREECHSLVSEGETAALPVGPSENAQGKGSWRGERGLLSPSSWYWARKGPYRDKRCLPLGSFSIPFSVELCGLC